MKTNQSKNKSGCTRPKKSTLDQESSNNTIINNPIIWLDAAIDRGHGTGAKDTEHHSKGRYHGGGTDANYLSS
jgi:hypothetical protein